MDMTDGKPAAVDLSAFADAMYMQGVSALASDPLAASNFGLAAAVFHLAAAVSKAHTAPAPVPAPTRRPADTTEFVYNQHRYQVWFSRHGAVLAIKVRSRHASGWVEQWTARSGLPLSPGWQPIAAKAAAIRAKAVLGEADDAREATRL